MFNNLIKIARLEAKIESMDKLLDKLSEKLGEETIKYRSALERINRELLGVRGLSIHCEKQIVKVKSIIQEVLNG